MTAKPASVCASPHSHHINGRFSNADRPAAEPTFAEQFAAVFGGKPSLPTPAELEAAVRMLRGHA